MSHLASILEAVKDDVQSGIVGELAQGNGQGYDSTNANKMVNETNALTEAVIQTVKQNTFTPLKVFISWMCRLYIEQGVKLSEIMAFFDLYEQSLKDVMSIYLKDDLVSLNYLRRETDTLLDKARVYLSDYFFVLYEEIVFKQFNQLRTINEITARLTSSLDLNEVLNFIITNALDLLNADCGSILLLDQNNVFSTRVAHGWQGRNSPYVIVRRNASASGVHIISQGNADCPLKRTFQKENLGTVITVKLYLQERLIGVLVVGFRSVRKVTVTEEQVLETFANQAAIAVNNAQLYRDKDNKLQERIHEVTVLLEQNRALLHSMREGVVAINAAGIINLINNEGKRLLNISGDVIGKSIVNVVPNSRLPFVVTSQKAEYDQEQKVGTTAIITNRVPVIVNGEVIGAIATFRDRQDVKQLAEELVGVKSLLESMRAQSHEFRNKLHAIAGLIEMEQYDTVVELIANIYKNRQECVSFIVKRIKEQATAGLLLGKLSQSNEQGILLRLSPRSRLSCLPANFTCTSMVTVLGNLISNAMEAVVNLPVERRIIDVHIFQGIKFLTISVGDKGCGIPQDCIKKIFNRGFSTKLESRGIGLALVKQEIELSVGRVSVRSVHNQGSTFNVKIPIQ